MPREIGFLDMDGVIADFVGAIHKAHGREYCYSDPSVRGRFEIEEIWGISTNEFWSTDSYEFWDGVQPTPEAEGIVSLVSDRFGVDNVAILTAPSDGPGCVPGKRAWMRRYFPQFHKRMIFCAAGAKAFLAGDGRYLIDDRDKNIVDFQKSGGSAILVPRHWNTEHAIADQVVGTLAVRIRP